MNMVRSPAVAGVFYPAESVDLIQEVSTLLARSTDGAHGKLLPKAIIAPHAGYIYSGPTAAAV